MTGFGRGRDAVGSCLGAHKNRRGQSPHGAVLRSVQELLSQVRIGRSAAAPTTPAAPPDARTRPAITREARLRRRGAVPAPIVDGRDLDIPVIPAAVRLLVLDTDVG